MNYTYATLIVPAFAQSSAKELLSEDYFNMGLSIDGTDPASHYVSAGPFSNEELGKALNQSDIPFWVNFGNEPNYHDLIPVTTD
jgi:hypothetical protein